MKHPWLKMNMVVMTVVALLTVLPAVSFASGAPPRGQFPECQEECLKKHNDKMHKLTEDYKATGNNLQYQDAVEAQSREYETCLESCRLRYPVK